ncbi:MAG: hypothetical protein ABIR18_08540 [Chitinophagaceae bacterium]
MRKKYLYSIIACTLFTAIHGQGAIPLTPGSGMSGPPVAPRDLSAFQNVVNINGQDGFYLKKDLYLTESYTIISGRKVLGIPFLFMNWLDGVLTTPDGRVYSDYKLKYNVQNQTISFLNGKDSLEVNEEIKEFTLKFVNGDSVITTRFVHSGQYQKGKSLYYEVLFDSEDGQLLKANQKVVASLSEGIIGGDSKKSLKLESELFYFDKKTKKISKVTPSSNIGYILHLNEQETTELSANAVNTSNEEEVIKFLKRYSERAKKAF